MNNFYCLISGLCISIMATAQPYNFIQAINPADTVLLNSPNRRSLAIEEAATPIVIDGVIDAQWDLLPNNNLDRYIMCRTGYTAGVYSCVPSTNRTPDNSDDFKASFKITYDDDYLYILYDVRDNEVNDGVVNPGVSERLEIMFSPYPDSAQQLLKGKPFPHFSGVAPATNMKFCYWHYLGAFKINFFLNASGNVTKNFDERADATKINYPQRISACQAAWKLKGDGSGYILEAAISLKVSLADSANNPFTVPSGIQKTIAFDAEVFDKDNGMTQISSSWNAQDDCSWDNMLYLGKMNFNASSGNGCSAAIPTAANVNVCYGQKAVLTASGGNNYRWYSSISGGSPLATTASYTTPALYSGTTYYVANFDSCESTRKAVVVSVISPTSITISPLKKSKYDCKTEPEQLSATPSGGTFSGDGVEVGYFLPSLAKINHINSIYYTIGDSACMAKDSIHVFVFPCSGIDNVQENGLKIYPNPANDYVMIANNENKSMSIQIVDLSGLILIERNLNGERLNIQSLSPGIYLLKVDGTVFKLIKQ